MRVVLAADGSPGSRLASELLQKLPIPQGVRITVASVTHAPALVEVGSVARSAIYPTGSSIETWRQERERAQVMLDSLGETLNGRGFVADTDLLEGDVADELLKLVRNEGANLIVTGSGESGDFSSFFLGSVSRKLSLNSEASVLIGRRFEGLTAEESITRLRDRGKLNLVVATDGSLGSEIAIDTLRRLRHPVFDTVTVLAVEPISDRFDEDRFSVRAPVLEDNDTFAESLVRKASEAIHRCADHVEWLTGVGRPSVEIGRVARLKKADLVVLAANRHAALERWLLGSCAYETATSAPCSVLILRDILEFSDAVRRQ